jgi:Lecithin retinol acyltransferase
MTTQLQRASEDSTVFCVDAARTSAVRSPDDELPLGAELVTHRVGYSHHGIYVGDGKVVHYAGLCRSSRRGPVEEVTVERFAAGHGVSVKANPFAAYVGMEAVRRARSRLGESRYRLLTNNCEHLCTWCLYGQARSEQVHACLAHPRLAWRVLSCLAKAFIGTRLHGIAQAA